MRFLILVVSLAIIGLVTVSCGDDDDGDDGAADDSGMPASEVMVNLKNWAIEPSAKTLAAGMVKFTAMHEAEHGAMDMSGQEGATHQLLVAPLPQGAQAGQSKFGSPVVNLTEIKPGDTKTAEAELSPRTYEFACLVVEQVGGETVNHYEKGMYTQVTVE
jgi:uncharacterized cupredoxin-like copper-binding protein